MHCSAQVCHSLAFAGMAYRVEFELQVQQDSLEVFAQVREILCQRCDPLIDGGQSEQQGTKFCHISSDIFFENRKKNVFFVFEVVIKGATSFSRFRGNVFEPGMFESVACEDVS